MAQISDSQEAFTAMFQSSNPAMRESVFEGGGISTQGTMTVNGTVTKTAILAVFAIVSAMFTFNSGGNTMMIGFGAGIVGFLVALPIWFKPELARFLAIPYAILKGLFLGAISAMFSAMAAEQGYPGIVPQAIVITFAILGTMLAAYRTGLIRATPFLQKVIVIAIFGIMATYLLNFVLYFFGMSIPFIHGAGPIGIAFSLFVIGIASLSLVLDFDFIERGSEMGAPKNMEWYGAFALIVTLIWIYIEVLKLLYKLALSRD
jgi:uncharacterized YccA/Bax inhibitor family protein